MNDYPSKQDFKQIRQLAKKCPSTINELLDKMKDVWWMPDWGYRFTKRRFLYLSTGGWSGNEDIISVLENTPFWWLYWVSSRRGGHYIFHIKKLRKSK